MAQLAGRGWTMNDFLVACLVLLSKNPQALLHRLQEFRPPKKSGRPPKKRASSRLPDSATSGRRVPNA
ncbi:hypothetical protein ACFW0V_22945 [Micromonospora parva]|uniref:hypothetical protein n=1 Tax=Micromonospora parva TaxID=1464048 RepID=UPI00366E95D6